MDTKQQGIINRERLKHHVDEIARLHIKADRMDRELSNLPEEAIEYGFGQDHVEMKQRYIHQACQHRKALGIYEEPELDVDQLVLELDDIYQEVISER